MNYAYRQYIRHSQDDAKLSLDWNYAVLRYRGLDPGGTIADAVKEEILGALDGLYDQELNEVY